MTTSSSGSFFGKVSGMFGGDNKIEKQMKKYMEFYYPAPSQCRYHIEFDWGEYIITTETKQGSEGHEDSKKYQGYITMRPQIKKPSQDLKCSIYLITPEGIVWENSMGQDIPEMIEREEVIEKKHEHGVTRSMNTIKSYSEPVIDHFLDNKKKWSPYGQLEVQKGKTKLKLAKE